MPVSDYVLKEAAGSVLASSADYDSNNHKVEDALLTALGPLVVSGGVVTAGTGLSVNITAAVFIIGVLLSKIAATLGGLAPSTANEIFAVTDPDDPDGFVYAAYHDGTVPARSAHIATVVTSGVGVTSVSTPADRYNLISLGALGATLGGNMLPFEWDDLTNTAVQVKATAGSISRGYVTNLSPAWRWLKIFNKNPVMGTDNATQNIGVAPGTTMTLDFGLLSLGGTAIYVAATAGYAKNDNSAVAAGDIVLNLSYQ